ncbi:hypothetical protein BCR44DRAFT_1434127, partial [Catenaria anguillulae PL171]
MNAELLQRRVWACRGQPLDGKRKLCYAPAGVCQGHGRTGRCEAQELGQETGEFLN